MFTTILLICVDSFVCSEGLLAFFTELITVGIKGPQGQDVRMDKKKIMVVWLSTYDIHECLRYIIIADKNGFKDWKMDSKILQYIKTLPCMIHIIRMICWE